MVSSSNLWVASNFTVMIDQQPTVVNAASATPSPVTGTTAVLSTLGNEGSLDSAALHLSYTWSTLSMPMGAVAPVFSDNNGENNLLESGASNPEFTAVTFSQAGNYTFQVTIVDPAGLTAVSTVSVTVVQTLTSIEVTPGNVTLADNATQQFTALRHRSIWQRPRGPTGN